MEARAGKYKLGARAGKYKLGARAGKYKFGARAGKYKLGARAGGRGPGPRPETKQRAGGREIQIPLRTSNLSQKIRKIAMTIERSLKTKQRTRKQ